MPEMLQHSIDLFRDRIMTLCVIVDTWGCSYSLAPSFAKNSAGECAWSPF